MIKETADTAYLNRRWEICEDMYNKVLNIDKDNIDATVGLMTVFQEKKILKKQTKLFQLYRLIFRKIQRLKAQLDLYY